MELQPYGWYSIWLWEKNTNRWHLNKFYSSYGKLLCLRRALLIVCRLIFIISINLRFMNVSKKFGNNVRKQRLEKGISQEQLAVLTNLHRTYIGGIERGERNPSLLNISKIAKALEVSVAALFEECD